MNNFTERDGFIVFLLSKGGDLNRFDENQIDAIEQFCFALFDNTDLNELSLIKHQLAQTKNELIFMLKQSMIIEHKQDHPTIKKLRKKHRVGF